MRDGTQSKKLLLGLAVLLELLSLVLFLRGAETAVATSLTAIGLTVLVVAVSKNRASRGR